MQALEPVGVESEASRVRTGPHAARAGAAVQFVSSRPRVRGGGASRRARRVARTCPPFGHARPCPSTPPSPFCPPPWSCPRPGPSVPGAGPAAHPAGALARPRRSASKIRNSLTPSLVARNQNIKTASPKNTLPLSSPAIKTPKQPLRKTRRPGGWASLPAARPCASPLLSASRLPDLPVSPGLLFGHPVSRLSLHLAWRGARRCRASRDAGLNQFSAAARARHFRGRVPGAVAGERAGHAVVVDGRVRECAGDLAAQQWPWRRRAESIHPNSAPER